jgi:hypothetical protein
MARGLIAGVGLGVALTGIIGGVALSQQAPQRVELVQPASQMTSVAPEPTPVPVETTATAIPTTTAAPIIIEDVEGPAPVESTTSAPAPVKKVQTVTKQQTTSSDPAPATTQPPAPDDPIRQTPPPPVRGNIVPGQPLNANPTTANPNP